MKPFLDSSGTGRYCADINVSMEAENRQLAIFASKISKVANDVFVVSI